MKSTFVLRSILTASLIGIAASASAAQSTYTSNKDVLKGEVSVAGNIFVSGYILPGAQSAASVENQQRSSQAGARNYNGARNDASLSNSLISAGGNIGVNVASGAGNAQANQVAMTVFGGITNAVSTALSNNGQVAGGSETTNKNTANNFAFLSSYALLSARGNIGVNLASGSGNLQSNALALSSVNSGPLSKATSGSDQYVVGVTSMSEGSAPNIAQVANDSLHSAIGNIGVNLASGTSNLQNNSLAISVAR